jgi:NAD(P)-dependent dehydrogenase (short-subunit alcohol dehydrogenase family)
MAFLAGTAVAITGAGRGIGRAEALELAGQGAAVVVGDLDESAARQTVAEIADRGGAAVASVGDTATTEAASQLVTTALERFGRLDAVVNNAGLLRDRTVAKMTDDEWDEVVRANLRGHFVVSRAAIRHWHAVGTGGRIVCTTSTSGLLGNFGQANYGSAKAGIAAFTQILAQEGWRRGITANAISPAARTRLSEGAYGAVDAEAGFDFWNADHVAPFVAFLCSAAAAHISGKVFGVQGDVIELYQPWRSVAAVENGRVRWSQPALEQQVARLFDDARVDPAPEDGMRRLRHSMRQRG